MSIEMVEKVYNSYARYYDFLFGKVFANGRVMAPDLLDLKPGTHLLEVGVGTGLSLPHLRKDVEITGVDLSQEMLNGAAKRVEELGYEHVRLMKMDATQLEFEDNTFDAVLAAYFISVVPEPIKVVNELKRVCKPGGYILFLNHFLSDNSFKAFFEKLISPICYRLGFHTNLNLHDLVAKCGLEIETLEPIDTLGHWKAVRCINPAKEAPAAAETPESKA